MKLLEILFPSNIYCMTCNAIINKKSKYAICDKCLKRFHWIEDATCEKCGKIISNNYLGQKFCVDCKENEHYYNRGYVCAQYGLYERTIIMSFKYGNKPYIGKILGKIMAERFVIEKNNPEDEVDIIIPVPIHKKRERKRGYNQAEILATVISKELKIPLGKKVVYRTKNTVPMKSLGALERTENVKNAFEVNQEHSNALINKKILLVDDIYTTGSTIDSVSKLLLEVGAEKVDFLAFAAGKN